MAEVILSNILSVLLTALGISISYRLSRTYIIPRLTREKERYRVVQKLEHREKDKNRPAARIILEKSSIPHAQGFMDIVLDAETDELRLDRYAFANTCNHNVIAPGKMLLPKAQCHVEKIESNAFSDYYIVIERIQPKLLEEIQGRRQLPEAERCAVEMQFDYPESYTGPHPTCRHLEFMKGIGLIYSETRYPTGYVRYRLYKWHVHGDSTSWWPVGDTGNYWVYEIEHNLNGCQNVTNIAD